ncbi:MAG: S8/S53 family peptidase, partial [Bacteroidota bacterium]
GLPNSSGAHGESCAGIIAATHNNGIGVRGVAPDVQLQTINIFAGNESITDLADAFYWAINNGSDVLSNSWGFRGGTQFNPTPVCNDPHPALTAAINDAATNGRGGLGCVVIFAAGNENGTCVTYPGNLPSVVAVGAISPRGNRSSYSNQGSALDVVAPSSDGVFGVRTTDREGSAGYGSGNYTNTFGGTSAACPAVAGVGALILAVDPNLTGPQVHSILNSTADDMGAIGFDNTYGNGRVNAHQAVLAAQGNGGGGGNGCTENELTLTIVTDQYPQETSWNITDANGATVASGGGYTSSSTTYTEDICLPDGCYTFTILDSYGDGICCAYGNGSYLLTDGSGTLASGGSFQSSEDTDFSLNANCGGGGGGGCSYTTIDSENFDSGWGIWNDGGSDCFRLSNTTYSNSGSYSIRLRDNSGVASSMTTDNINLSAYNRVKIDFTYITNSMDNANEDFFFEVSTNGGSSYQLLEEWNLGDEFQNNQREFETLVLTGGFTSNTRFRFRCDASANGDQVYIDDVVISACNDSGNIINGGEEDVPTFDFTDNSSSPSNSLQVNDLNLYPNPSSTMLNVDLTLANASASITEIVVMDITGKTVLTKQLAANEDTQFTVDVSNFVEGMYYLFVVNED